MELPNKEVFIRPLIKAKFSGLARYNNKNTTVLSTELTRTGYATGLTKDEEKELEKMLGLKEGALSKHPLENPDGSNYWSNLEIRIPLKGVVLQMSRPTDYLRYKVALASQKIANSMLELSKWPSAEFVIYDETSEAEVEAEKIDIETEAFAKYAESTLEDKKKYLKLYGERGVDNMAESVLKTKLFRKVKADPKLFTSIASDKRLDAKVLAEELLEYGIVKKTSNHYKDGDDFIANSMEDFVDFVESPKNSARINLLKGKIQALKKGK